ncbi:Filamin-A [Thelohanellus kitauei]|uniref:Filamin-A n=1 Tax=Thelohanellus kitauei TaxID=669202 RepID=A0A0C2JG18_THEKT|nr:Filamin-A [Thelohanellus kitauei]
MGSHKYTYIPSEPGKYSIKVGYGEALCTYKEYSVNVYGRMSINSNDTADTIDVQWAPEHDSTILQQIIINIPNKSIKLENVVVEVFDKDENSVQTEIDLGSSYSNKKTEKSLIKFSFRVAEFGRFRASVKENGHELPGSPFFLNITKENTYVGAISCVAYGPSLAEATIGEDNYFYVNMKDAGDGKIDFLIIGPSKVDIMSQECKDNVYIVHWKPLVEGSYSIQIKYDGFQIPGSPFWVKALKKSSLEVHVSLIVEKQNL